MKPGCQSCYTNSSLGFQGYHGREESVSAANFVGATAIGNNGPLEERSKSCVGDCARILSWLDKTEKGRWVDELSSGLSQRAREVIDITLVEEILKRIINWSLQKLHPDVSKVADGATEKENVEENAADGDDTAKRDEGGVEREEETEAEEQDSDEYVWAEDCEEPEDPKDVAAEEKEARRRLIEFLKSR